MARFTTPLKKEEVLAEIIAVFEDYRDQYFENPGDPRLCGSYTALMDLLSRVQIYDREE